MSSVALICLGILRMLPLSWLSRLLRELVQARFVEKYPNQSQKLAKLFSLDF